jgi:metal-responsive CopG/Arc/MetJ family transcriptional regulator
MREPRFQDVVRVRLPVRLRARLEETARREERTHSEIIRDALRKSLGSDQRQERDDG